MAWLEMVSYWAVDDGSISDCETVGCCLVEVCGYWAGYILKVLVGCGTWRWDCTLNSNWIVGLRWIEYGCG